MIRRQDSLRAEVHVLRAEVSLASVPLAQLDHDHAGQDQQRRRAAGPAAAARRAAARRTARAATHLEQRDERRQPRAEPAAGGDAGDVGERRGDQAEHQERHPPGDACAGVRRPRRWWRRIGSRPTSPSDAEHRGADDAGRRRPATSGGRPLSSSAEITKYVAAPTIAASAHSTPTRLRSAPESRSRTSTRPSAATTGADQRDRPGPLAVPQPQPDDDRRRRGVLDEQRRPDLHVLRPRRSSRTGSRPPRPRRRAATSRALRRSSAQRPRSATTPNGSTTSGAEHDPDQHRRRRRSSRRRAAPRASAPDRPNETADTTANPSPRAERGCRPPSRCVSWVNVAMTDDTTAAVV